MITANVNGSRVFPTPNTKGICPYCQSNVSSKCGEINVWHFAHISLGECDYWKEHESEWHLKWKSWFDKENIEHIRSIGDKKHIADIFIKGNIIELQASAMPPEIRRQRELFWGNSLRWIVKSEFDRLRFWKFIPMVGKKTTPITREELISYPLLYDDYPVLWKWARPKKWITYDPPGSFYIDLDGSNFILKVEKLIDNNFGRGRIFDRVRFVNRLKGMGVLS